MGFSRLNLQGIGDCADVRAKDVDFVTNDMKGLDFAETHTVTHPCGGVEHIVDLRLAFLEMLITHQLTGRNEDARTFEILRVF